MLLINEKPLELTLKLTTDPKNEFVKKEAGATTLISEEKTIYFFMEPDCPGRHGSHFYKVRRFLKNFVANNKYDINIDFDSFALYFEKKSDVIFRNLIETILFETHKSFKMKKDCNCAKGEKCLPKVQYNVIYSDKKYDEIVEASKVKLEFVNYARDLQDLPPNLGTSVDIANRIEMRAKAIEGLKVTILTKKEIEAKGMGLLLAVNAASEVEPRVVVLEYCGDSSKPKTALVGKGITFDSGGYNLKPGNFMVGMKFDMSGAAIMSATVMALAAAKAKANVMSIGMFTDNRIGGHGTLTESVITSYNGQTVQIDNTDAEGRLVLADGITYAVRDGKADQIIEASTLTGAIVVALGHWHTGVFTKDDELWSQFSAAAEVTPELVWRMPMIPEHLERMQETPIADLTNAEPQREAGSSTAAAFLDSFAEGKPYMHLDIAGTADDGKRGKGVMVRTLFELLK